MSMQEPYQYNPNSSDDELLERRRMRRAEMKRKRLMRQRIIIGVTVAILLLIIVLIARGCSKPKETEYKKKPTLQEEPTVETSSDTTATLAAVGDIMVYENQIKAAQIDELTYDFMPSFAAIRAYTESADLTVGNLELNFLGGPSYSGTAQGPTYFNAPESLADVLNTIGFDVLQTANTYTIVNGIDGLKSTINYLHQAGIDAVGSHLSDPAKSTNNGVVIRYSQPNEKGIKFAFIGFTKGLNGMTIPANNTHSVDLLYTDYNKAYETIAVASITERIEAAKAHNPDVIVAMVHWGSEYDLEISDSQKDIRDLMFKNGVDVIIGSHTHYVGPMETHEVETVDGEEKTCIVAYSLGNFISGMEKGEYKEESVILNLEFFKDADTGKTSISDISYVPLYVLDRGADTTDTRFEVLPIRDAIASSTCEEYETEMEAAIETLKTNTKSDYDSGQ